MPRRNLDDHFENERPEWTKRKHLLLERYVKAAATKMRMKCGFVGLVDGYAGVNAYGSEATGSTIIMLEAAKQVRKTGDISYVYACEPHEERYKAMCSNLASEITEGLLKTYNEPHEVALPKIQRELGTRPAIVFLDPQTATQLTLERDVLPWVCRKSTDILGVFMAGQACRCCSQFNRGHSQKIHPEEYLGSNWRNCMTEEGAFNTFFEVLGGQKRFKGLYRLRKKNPLKNAYGIFGLSDHADGYWLLSNAVAKDYGILNDFDHQRHRQNNLFADEERESHQQASFQILVDIAKSTIIANPKLRGAKLASFLFKNGIGVEELFGQYVERDYTSAVYEVLGLPDKRTHAKTKYD